MKVLHMSGAGNDFMVLDSRGMQLNFEELSKALCDQYGTDGFMALDASSIADFKLHFYNADGTRGEMCGNGARCICKYAYDLGIVRQTMTVETDAGIVYGWHLGENHYRVQLNNPGVVDLRCRPDAAYVELGTPGVPHSVTELPTLDWAERERLLPAFLQLRNAEDFPKGVNVNMYRHKGESTVQILTFERGVEDYTLACGTGSASVAVVLALQGKLPAGHLTVENPGGTLEVTVEQSHGQITALYLEGPAEVIGEYEI